MSDIRFDWDDAKARANLLKHRIDFREAQSVFFDENAKQIPDPEHSEAEDRFVMLGMSQRLRVLVAYRESDSVIRLISARKASKREQRQYWEQ